MEGLFTTSGYALQGKGHIFASLSLFPASWDADVMTVTRAAT